MRRGFSLSSFSLFQNPTINRSLSRPSSSLILFCLGSLTMDERRAVCDFLAQRGSGNWDHVSEQDQEQREEEEKNEDHGSFYFHIYVYPLSDLSADLLRHVVTYNLSASIFTFFELLQGDDFANMRSLTRHELTQVLCLLEEEGRVVLFREGGIITDETGVKFQ